MAEIERIVRECNKIMFAPSFYQLCSRRYSLVPSHHCMCWHYWCLIFVLIQRTVTCNATWKFNPVHISMTSCLSIYVAQLCLKKLFIKELHKDWLTKEVAFQAVPLPCHNSLSTLVDTCSCSSGSDTPGLLPKEVTICLALFRDK